ncbi:MAG: glycosyltransferase family 92 protein [Selenomonadaceae bacterium]|nr:glycosyltransferase family 92 protein [Selenomonadaceae bacterium]
MDKNLFRYDLAVVAILKNEGRYIKEWLDYHLLAGVDHFYLYDNDSTDDYNEIIAPYVEAGLVTNTPLTGGSAQFAAYAFALRDWRFFCRYMAFIDLDEFIFPKTGQSIVEVADEILSRDKSASSVAINWQMFGSNGQETADYSRGVLERFTRRAPVDWVVPIPHRDIPGGNSQIKTITNPRKVYTFFNGHNPIYFGAEYAINEIGERVDSYYNEPVTAEKIAVNHYNVKSREEHLKKVARGRADKGGIAKELADKGENCIDPTWFNMYDRNEIFDDGILRYRAAREKIFSLPNDEQRFFRVHDTLTKILSAYASGKKFSLETALTCRAVSSLLRKNFPYDEHFKVYEEAALAAVLNSLEELSFADVQLLLSELPEMLKLPYPVVDELRGACLQIISRTLDFLRESGFWKDFVDMDNLRRFLEAWR